MTTSSAADTPNRRMGPPESKTREQLLDVAERIIAEEGCDAITARRLSEQLGLKRQILHYYFRSVEDLIVAVIRRQGDRLRDRIDSSSKGGRHSQDLWRPGSDSPTAVFEFVARAARSEPVRDEVRRYLTELRELRVEALTSEMEHRNVEPAVPPIAVATILTAVSQALAQEEAIDVTLGHEETRRYIESWLQAIEQGGTGLPG